MKVIIAGSRTIEDYEHVVNAVRASGFEVTTVVCGMAQGVDLLGLAYAEANGIPVIKMPADWNQYGKSAGYRRNVEMANVADAVIAVYDGESRGTQHMIDIANTKGLRVHVHYPYAPTPVEVVDDHMDREALAIANWLAEKKTL